MTLPPGEAFVMPTYGRYPLTLVRGEGTVVYDDRGSGYLDFAGGLGALSLGHAHPSWLRAVSEQAATLGLVSNLFSTEPQASLAQRLAELLPIPQGRVFFCNSGAEANEAALKLVRKWGLPRGRSKIVAMEGSFHGRTIATLAATGQPPKRAAFEPLLDWFVHVPAGDPKALASALADDVAAVLLEPVLGEGGVRPLPIAYLRAARELCDRSGALLVADEVQSGLGRCGDWLAISHAGVVPDVVTLAKGLGGGLPIGACVGRAGIAFAPGDHASTFGGGPVPCAAALAVLETIERDGLLENAREMGDLLRLELERAKSEKDAVEVRGRGLLVGVELPGSIANDVVLAMIRRGVLATEAGPNVVRLSPPLIVSSDDVAFAAKVFGEALSEVTA